jgi:hypothetical protein
VADHRPTVTEGSHPSHRLDDVGVREHLRGLLNNQILTQAESENRGTVVMCRGAQMLKPVPTVLPHEVRAHSRHLAVVIWVEPGAWRVLDMHTFFFFWDQCFYTGSYSRADDKTIL